MSFSYNSREVSFRDLGSPASVYGVDLAGDEGNVRESRVDDDHHVIGEVKSLLQSAPDISVKTGGGRH